MPLTLGPERIPQVGTRAGRYAASPAKRKSKKRAADPGDDIGIFVPDTGEAKR